MVEYTSELIVGNVLCIFFNYYVILFGKYCSNNNILCRIGYRDQKEGFEDSVFRIRDRLALMYEIITTNVEFGGCGIRVETYQKIDHPIVDLYPLHMMEHLECILDKLFSWKALTYNILSLPLEEIRSYFGEYIGIYFAYLEFMTIYFVPLAIIGFILQIMQWSEWIVLVNGIQYFSLIVILWSVCFPIIWKRINGL